MKNLIVSIIIAGLFAFGLQSCGTDDPCEDIICPIGEVCIAGVCVVNDACATVTCPAGEICVNGVCVLDDPCNGVVCAAGEICVNGVCIIDTNPGCSECGTYTGTVSSTAGNPLVIPGIIDSTLVGLPATSTVSQTTTTDVLELTVTFTVNGIPLAPTVEGTLVGSTLTVSNEVYNYSGINIAVDAVMNFTTDALDGTITLSEGPTPSLAITGEIEFTGTK